MIAYSEKPKRGLPRPPGNRSWMLISALLATLLILSMSLLYVQLADEDTPSTLTPDNGLLETQVALALTQTAIALPPASLTPTITGSPTATATPPVTASSTTFQISMVTATLDAPQFEREDNRIFALEWSPDGRSLAVGTADSVLIYDSNAWGAPPLDFAVESGTVYGVAFSPDSQTIAAAGADGQIRLWDVISGEALNVQFNRTTFFPIWSLAFNVDGSLLITGEDDGNLRTWDVHTGTQQAIQQFHVQPVVSLAIQGDLLLAGSYDGRVSLWQLPDLSPVTDWLYAESSEVYNLAINTDATEAAVVGEAGIIQLWNITENRQSSIRLPSETEAINVVAFNPAGTLLITGGDMRQLKIWNLDNNQRQGTIDYAAPVTGSAFSPDGSLLATGSLDGRIQLWDTQSWEAVTAPIAIR